MERHLSTGVTTLVALMEAGRKPEPERPDPAACPWSRLVGQRPEKHVPGLPTDEPGEG